MNQAQQFVEEIYAKFSGRVPLKVGITRGFGMVYPLVFQNPQGQPIGLIGCAWNDGTEPDLVQIYHMSTFQPGNGSGTEMLTYLCSLADRLRVQLYVQAEAIGAPDQKPIDQSALIAWYRRFGFNGKSTMLTRPRHEA